MNKNVRWKLIVIVGVVALAIWAFYPPDQKVNLGLDLKGGVHLVMRVRTDEALKTWRLGAAAGKPAFTVASNKTLSAIAAVRPQSDESLLAISGVGPAFIEKYAPEVLEIVAEHAQPLAA